MAKATEARHINTPLLTCSILGIDGELNKLLKQKGLPLNSLELFLESITLKKDAIKVWEEGFKVDIKQGYNASKVDKITPRLNSYAINFKEKHDNMVIDKIPSFFNTRQDIINSLTSGRKKVLIIGESGSGRTALVESVYKQIKQNNVPESLKYNRIVDLDLSTIVSLGARGTEVFSTVLNEFNELKNTILFLDNIDILYEAGGYDYLNILISSFENPNSKIVATTSLRNYTTKIQKNSVISNSFIQLKVPELEGKDLTTFLVFNNVFLPRKLSLPSIKLLTDASDSIMFSKKNPAKSISIVNVAVANCKNRFVDTKLIQQTIKKLTGVVVGEIYEEESKKLLNLEQQILGEVIGQPLAVKELSNALLRARSGARGNTNKPIASFLFAGPTGVGKTELAKSLSRTYFGSEKDIIRLDMSEYQNTESIYRLIGSEDGSNPGILTEKVKQTPFNLILLDEIEKASRNVHMLFLQVLDDGRLTDSTGQTVSFKNTIIIATTNAGTQDIINLIMQKVDSADIKEKFLQNIKNFFPPEFLNRFTDLILFNSLSRQDIEKILEIKLKKLYKNFSYNHQINLKLKQEVKNYLIEKGYSTEWGARSLDRVIDRYINTSLSKALIYKQIKQGDSLVVDMGFVNSNL